MAKPRFGLVILFVVLGMQTAVAAPEIMVTTPLSVGSARHAIMGATTTTNVVVRNSGDGMLQVTGATFVGGNTGDFSLGTVTFPIMIAGNQTANIPVVFDPAAVGARMTAIRIASNDATDPTEDVTLNGTGTTAAVTLTAPSFGALVQGGATATASITVTNSAMTNQGPLGVTSASMPAATWFSFGAGSGCTVNSVTCTLNANVSATPLGVPVQCKPPAGASGTTMTTVTFVTDADTGTETVDLTCTAGTADIDTDVASIAFGAQKRNTNGDRALTISNLGTFTLTYNIAFSGTDAAMFSIVAPGCTAACVLAPGGSTAVTVRFRPTSTGAKTATLSFTSNDPDENPYTLALTGTGTAPIADPDPLSFNFNSVELGATSADTSFTITNNGDATLVIASAATTSTSFNITSGPVGGATVNVGASVTYTVNCAPLAQGMLSGSLRIISDTMGTAGSQTNVPLTCNGTRGFLTVAPSPIVNFGGVAVGNESTIAVTLTNTGNLPVTGITATLADPNVGYSIVSPTFPIDLAAGAFQTVQVKFAPLNGDDGGDVLLTFEGVWGASSTPVSVATTLRGDGLTTGLDVSPPAIAFGDFRWDTAPFRYICVKNTGQAAFNITLLSLAPEGVTSSAELRIIRLIRRTCGTTGGNSTPYASALPFTINANENVEIEIQADPADRVGPLAGTVTLVTNLPTNNSDTTAISGNSTTAALTTLPGATVDFGAVDIDGPAQTQTITIRNTGDGPLDLGAFTRMGTAPAFVLTLPSSRTLLPGEQLDVVVTFDPTVERAANQPETITVTHNIVGVLGGPVMGTFTITGRGVDRHLQLGMAPAFPPTFRNPGSMAPTRVVTVMNTGEAPLAISAVMVTNTDVWQLVDPSPVTIPPLGSHDFEVRFTPTVAGAAPTGTLTFTNDDNAMPMAMILLDGIGRDRQVGLLGDPVQLGITGIGIPITLSGGLVVQSMDSENMFAIREIVLQGDTGVFTIEDSPTNDEIAPSATRAYDITFAPDAEGEFEAQATLFLDEDPTQAAQVTIRGQAVFVDVGGGGGCSTSHGGAGGFVVLLGAVLAGLRRRALVAAMIVGSAATAHAQSATGFDLDLSQFDPTPSTTGTTMQVQSAEVGRDGDWVASALVANASNPLVLNYAGSEHAAISRRTTFTVGGAYAFLGRFEGGLHMPLYNQTGDGDAVGVASPRGTARGDLVAHVRAKLLQTRGSTQLIAGTSLSVTLPTASGEQFAGVDAPTARLLGLLTVKPSAADGRLAVLANVGPVVRGASTLGNYEQGSGVSFGGALSVRILPALWAAGEIYGEAMPSARASGPMEAFDTQMTLEWLTGFTYRPDPRLAIGAAIGSAVASAPGTSDLRAVFSIAVTPTVRQLPPIREIYEDSPAGDNDDDGLANAADKCPDAPEDKDRFEDTDGCPELDNDHDTFADDIDPCPVLAEDLDGVNDGDGCPDLDDDNDGIADTRDKCPRAIEDKDGFADEDGCPDPDNDRDGVMDAADKCATNAETINGLTDDDGCPDVGDSAVQVTPSAIELLEAVKFNGVKLARGADKVLNQVAQTLRAHPEILRLKINVHVDAAPEDAKAKELSEQRAIVVRDHLLKAGIASDRISGAGWGGTKPLIKGKRSPFNDRIELIVLERK